MRLAMMQIPPGRFVMGAPEGEEGSLDYERPQHEVSVAGFFMGRYPVMQAQWRSVVGYEPIEQELDSDLSYFKGDNRPVKQVGWDEVLVCGYSTQFPFFQSCQSLSRQSSQLLSFLFCPGTEVFQQGCWVVWAGVMLMV